MPFTFITNSGIKITVLKCLLRDMETKSSSQGTQPRRRAGLRAEKLLTSQGRRASATPILPAPPQPRGQTPGWVGRLCTWTDPSPFTLRLRVEGGCVPLWLALSADPVPSWSPSCSSFQGVVRFWLVLDLERGQGSWSSTQISRDLIIKGSSCPEGEGFFLVGGAGGWREVWIILSPCHTTTLNH